MKNVQGKEIRLGVKVGKDVIEIPCTELNVRAQARLARAMAAIEGTGRRWGMITGVRTTGGFTTALTLETVPTLFVLMFGQITKCTENWGKICDLVDGTQNLYRYEADLFPETESYAFNLVKMVQYEGLGFPLCTCKGFELRFERDNAVYARFEVNGDKGHVPVVEDGFKILRMYKASKYQERFMSNNVTYQIDNGSLDTSAIYGATLRANKSDDKAVCEIALRRVLKEIDLPTAIASLTITARLLNDCYEPGRHGKFSISLSNLVLAGDETNVDCADAVLGERRYVVMGEVKATVYAEGTDAIL
jgi:hypothetical protein